MALQDVGLSCWSSLRRLETSVQADAGKLSHLDRVCFFSIFRNHIQKSTNLTRLPAPCHRTNISISSEKDLRRLSDLSQVKNTNNGARRNY